MRVSGLGSELSGLRVALPKANYPPVSRRGVKYW